MKEEGGGRGEGGEGVVIGVFAAIEYILMINSMCSCYWVLTQVLVEEKSFEER